MLGTNYERASVEVRERMAFGSEDLIDGVRQIGHIAREGVILSTCNRTELYGLFDAGVDGGAALRQLVVSARDLPNPVVSAATYQQAGPEAIRHLYRVSCGLNSMMLGEPQILTQVQDALAIARSEAVAGPVITRLCTDALRVGKLARTKTGIARNRLSISHAAIDLAAREIGTLAGRRVVVLGADGAYQSEFRVEGWAGRGVDDKPYLRVLRDGRIAVSLPSLNTVRIYDASGAVKGTVTTEQDPLSRPYGMVETLDGKLWIVEGGIGRVRQFPIP